MTKAAIYMRVSTDKQTCSNQREPLLALARQRGFDTIEVIEEIESAARVRPKLDLLCERARKAEIGAIIVASVDRLSRSAIDLLERVEALDRAGCRLISLRDGWLDSEGPARALVLSVMGAVAQLERDTLIQRTKAGLQRARREGVRLGRPPMSPVAVAAIKARAARGESISRIAREVGCSRPCARKYARA